MAEDTVLVCSHTSSDSAILIVTMVTSLIILCIAIIWTVVASRQIVQIRRQLFAH